jgi:DMSO/TMAO reductase YedYZ molybdopterin-dependent catalytic subunit
MNILKLNITYSRRILIFIVSLLSGLSIFNLILCASGRLQMKEMRVPPGQTVIDDFPNLYIGNIPNLTRKNWQLSLVGASRDTVLDWNAFSQMDTLTVISDFHCVTGWSRFDNRWTGVLIRDVINLVQPADSVKFITFYSADGYSTFLPIGECIGDRDLLAFRWEGKDLNTETGGPVRVVLPRKYGYKSAKWIIKMVFSSKHGEGYWESRGYSETADPWRDDRYQSKDNPVKLHQSHGL